MSSRKRCLGEEPFIFGIYDPFLPLASNLPVGVCRRSISFESSGLGCDTIFGSKVQGVTAEENQECKRKVQSTPETIRTSDTRLRRPLLYPAELRGHEMSADYTDF